MADLKVTAAEPDLSTRDVRVLQAIIQDYIEHAEPVGSRTLTRGHGLDVSPATVRNVMADLEHLGYLAKPHTSAGRIPTSKAFRLYVDALLPTRPLASRARAQVDRQYAPPPADVPERLLHTGKVLHRLTHLAAVVALPRLAQEVFREIRFIRLRDDRVLAVLVTGAGLVQNRVLTVEVDVTQAELDRAGNYLESILEGTGTIAEVRQRIEAALVEERAAYDQLQARALELGREALEASPGAASEVIVEGAASFLDVPEFADATKARGLLEALEGKELILRMLERAEDASGIQIFIGAESELAGEDVSVVVASYRRGETVLGTLGVIGPTRMDYGRVAPLVGYTASLLTRTFADEDA